MLKLLDYSALSDGDYARYIYWIMVVPPVFKNCLIIRARTPNTPLVRCTWNELYLSSCTPGWGCTEVIWLGEQLSALLCSQFLTIRDRELERRLISSATDHRGYRAPNLCCLANKMKTNIQQQEFHDSGSQTLTRLWPLQTPCQLQNDQYIKRKMS